MHFVSYGRWIRTLADYKALNYFSRLRSELHQLIFRNPEYLFINRVVLSLPCSPICTGDVLVFRFPGTIENLCGFMQHLTDTFDFDPNGIPYQDRRNENLSLQNWCHDKKIFEFVRFYFFSCQQQSPDKILAWKGDRPC